MTPLRFNSQSQVLTSLNLLASKDYGSRKKYDDVITLVKSGNHYSMISSHDHTEQIFASDWPWQKYNQINQTKGMGYDHNNGRHFDSSSFI